MDHAAISHAVELAELDPVDLDGAEIVGEDPVYPSPHHLGEGAAVTRPADRPGGP